MILPYETFNSRQKKLRDNLALDAHTGVLKLSITTPSSRLGLETFITLDLSPCQIVRRACFVQPDYAIPVLERHLQLCLRSV
jgi:hypothetical protein